MAMPAHTDILRVNVSAINMEMTLESIGSSIRQRQHNNICNTGVHGVNESQSDPRLREIHNLAAFVTPDGMPLVWVLR